MRWQLFEGVPDQDCRELLKLGRRRTFVKNEVVCHRGDPADTCHLIVSGHFAVRIATPVGDTVTIAVRGPGATFGEMALLVEDGSRTATVAALERAETLAIHRDSFERFRSEYPSVERALWAFLVGEVRRLNELLLESLYVSVEKRVRRRLVELVDLFGDGRQETTIPLTQDVIAELAGASRPTVNGILREEERRGLVELRRGQTIVLDVDNLRRRAR
jgi:CRP-like cAMP-binding protein